MSSHDGPDPDAKTLHAVPSTNRLVDELCGAKLAPVLILLSIYIVTRGGGGERGGGIFLSRQRKAAGTDHQWRCFL